MSVCVTALWVLFSSSLFIPLAVDESFHIILHFISYHCCFAFFLSTEMIENLQLCGAARQKPIDSPPKGSV